MPENDCIIPAAGGRASPDNGPRHRDTGDTAAKPSTIATQAHVVIGFFGGFAARHYRGLAYLAVRHPEASHVSPPTACRIRKTMAG